MLQKYIQILNQKIPECERKERIECRFKSGWVKKSGAIPRFMEYTG